MNTLVVALSAENKPLGRPWRPQFEQSCKDHGVQVNWIPLFDHDPSQDGKAKLVAIAEACVNRRKSFTHVMYVDSWDSVLLRPLHEIEEAYTRLDTRMLLAGSSKIWPCHELRDKFPYADSGSPLRFPTSSGFIGEIDHFLDLITRFKLRELERHGPFDDAEWWQHLRVAAPWAYKIDVDADVFVTLSGWQSLFEIEVPRKGLRFVPSGTRPSVVIGNGGNFASMLTLLARAGRDSLSVKVGQHESAQEKQGDPPKRVLLGRGLKNLEETVVQTSDVRRWVDDYGQMWSNPGIDQLNALSCRLPVDQWDQSAEEILRGLLEHVKNDDVVVEYGCGAGRLTKRLAKEAAQVVAFDCSEDMGRAMKRYCGDQPNIVFCRVDGPRLGLFNKASAAVAWDVLGHVAAQDCQAILGELNRTLQPGGSLLVNFPDALSPSRYHDFSGSAVVSPRLYPCTLDLARTWLRRAGFDETKLISLPSSPDLVFLTCKVKEVGQHSSCSRERTFYHSGDAGDIVYSLPTVKALGGGRMFLGKELAIKYKAGTRVMMTRHACENIRRLLEAQPYITEVIFTELFPAALVEHNLNTFRNYLIEKQTGRYWNNPGFSGTKSLAVVHQETFNVSGVDEREPWLRAEPRVIDGKTVVMARSERYQNPRFPWVHVVNRYASQAVFVGSEKEHQLFTSQFGYVERVQTTDLYDVAQVISGAAVFVGNQSCPFAIAEGLKKPCVQESWDHDPNCMFDRPDALYQVDQLDEIVGFIDRVLGSHGLRQTV